MKSTTHAYWCSLLDVLRHLLELVTHHHCLHTLHCAVKESTVEYNVISSS